MAQAGLLEWSNSIRFNMATDPGRQLFQDQINTYGFLFLDDYLDNILSGAKQDPLIELVKTPGRKKAIAMKPKPISKLNGVTSSFQDEDGKGNVTPINNFHKALLEANRPPAPFQSNPDNRLEQPGSVVENMPFASPANPVFASSERHETSSTAQVNGLLAPAPAHIDQNELSAIAEDDEPEHSDFVPQQGSCHDNGTQPRVSVKANRPTSGSSDTASPLLGASFQEAPQATSVTTSASDTFHSITLDSPPPSEVPVRSPSPLPTAALDACPPKSFEGEEYENTNIHNILAPLSSSKPGTQGDAPPPSITPATTRSFVAQSFDAPLRNDSLVPSSPKNVETKPSPSLYPALPAPMPLRKSMRAPRDPSVGAGPLGTTTPGAGLAGKRTSWLKKAREVKALEGTSRNVATLAGISQPHMPLSTNPLKRKSGDMLTIPTTTGLEDEERHHKAAKNAVGDIAPLQPQTEKGKGKEEQPQIQVQSSRVQLLHEEHEGMLDRLKKTVEGLGARVGKSMGKSLGAGTALAEARAAAEARVAERNSKDEELTKAMAMSPIAAPETNPQSVRPPTLMDERKAPNSPVLLPPSTREAERRLSISDLFPPNDGIARIKSKASERIFQITPPVHQPTFSDERNMRRESGTTTPPNSPPATRPASFVLPPGPVFNKPPPVFVPPAPTPHSATIASVPAALRPIPLTAQSTIESIESDRLFDRDDDVPAWMPTTQDTEDLSSQDGGVHTNASNEDDSWPLDEKLAAGVPWTFGGGSSRGDSLTWSTVPSQSQRFDTVQSTKERETGLHQTSTAIPGLLDVEMDNEEQEVSQMVASDDIDLEELVTGGVSTVNLVEPKVPRSQSQLSMASSVSSQSQPGFFGQASKLLTSALGTSKKGKPEVKNVLQKAAVAAKKQQEEDGKKAARLKDMETRRQLANQRKAEEEKARKQEEEKKLREEGERRKRERDEHTDKRPLKIASGKKDEESAKKRKMTVEAEKPVLRKPSSKSILKSTTKQQPALHSSTAYNTASQQSVPMQGPSEVKPSKPSTTAVPKSKGKAPSNKQPLVEDELTQPSQLVYAQMSARAKAQLRAAKQTTGHAIQSESIELPDINSEYSDSEDEDRVQTFNPPQWAQSPELRHALQVQSTINPDDIFGSVKPLKMEELFKTRTSRFRARTSSANWTGADRLTLEEERDYARRMGFR